jgi:hypothetical protein
VEDATAVEQPWRGINVKINAGVLRLAQRAYATTWHEEETDSMVRWVSVAIQRHLDRSPLERAEAAAWLPRVEPAVTVPCKFRLDRQLVAAMDAAVLLDVEARGLKNKRSPWLVEAIRVATLETDRAWNGLDELACERLPWPPARAGLLA